MFLRSLVPALLLAFAPTTDASVSLDSFHKFAIRHSAGLARDLRVALGGLSLLEPRSAPQLVINSNRVLCVRPDTLVPAGNQGGSGSNNRTQGPSTTTKGRGPSTTSTRSAGGAQPTNSQSSAWKLQESHQGNNFFSGWDFFQGADPTHGIVTFVDQPTAQSNNLASINGNGNAIMGVETTPQVQNTRMSVRITTQSTFTGGLFVLDAVHMPTGCGTWPAFWTNGPNWPAGGEIDIVEGVNDYTNNQATIHANPGCTIPSDDSKTLGITGTLVGGTNCAASQTGNQGCGVRSNQANFGAAFNSAGGGVYAMLWTDAGIAVYFFPRNAIPSDLTNEAPQPSNWGQPMAAWPSTSCNTTQFFYAHSAIFDTTLCGDWASSAWTGTGIPGQDQSCAARTGHATCEDYVRSSGSSFQDAYWEVSSVKIYQTSRQF